MAIASRLSRAFSQEKNEMKQAVTKSTSLYSKIWTVACAVLFGTTGCEPQSAYDINRGRCAFRAQLTDELSAAWSSATQADSDASLRFEGGDQWIRVTDQTAMRRGLFEHTDQGWQLRAQWPVGDSSSLVANGAYLSAGWKAAWSEQHMDCASLSDLASAADVGEKAMRSRPKVYRTGEKNFAVLRFEIHSLCAVAVPAPLGEWKILEVFTADARPRLVHSGRHISAYERMDLDSIIEKRCRNGSPSGPVSSAL